MLVLALLVPGFVTAVGVIAIGNVSVLAIAFAIGLGNGVASRSIAVLQTTVRRVEQTRTRGAVRTVVRPAASIRTPPPQ